jgi:hypothetical protein
VRNQRRHHHHLRGGGKCRGGGGLYGSLTGFLNFPRQTDTSQEYRQSPLQTIRHHPVTEVVFASSVQGDADARRYCSSLPQADRVLPLSDPESTTARVRKM